MRKCEVFSDYIGEDYIKELRWIKQLKSIKWLNLMQLSMQVTSKVNNLAMAEDYLTIAHMEEKIFAIEIKNSTFSQEEKYELEETDLNFS